MSQNDFTIANQGFPAFRADLNSALQALASNSSGATAPSTTFSNMWWYDSANNIMYIRNEDNDAWIKFAELDQTNDKFVLSGTLQLDDGTVSAPALTFNSDTNMGIYRGGTDILKFVTAGTDAITIDASQNVGIGESDPSSPLHIFGSSPKITLEHSNQNGTAQIYTTAQSGLIFDADPDNTDNGTPIQLKTDGKARLLVEDSGDISFYEDTGTTPKFFWDSSAEALGIGTSSPAHFLDVVGQNAGTDATLRIKTTGTQTYSDAFLYLETAGSGITGIAFGDSADDNVGLINYDHSDNSLYIRTNATRALTIDNSQNLLVGHTSQYSPIGDGGSGVTIGANGQIFSGCDFTNLYLNAEDDNNEHIRFRKDGADVGSIGTTNGDLYIGTGDTGIRFHDGDNSIYTVNTAGGAKIDGAVDLGEPAGRFKDLYLSGGIGADSTISMSFSAGGNIGIGNTGPGYPLDVGTSSLDKRARFQGNNQYRLALQNGTNNLVWLGSGGADNFRISNSSGATVFQINSSGNVGIGDASNIAKLMIESNLSSYTGVNVKNNNSNNLGAYINFTNSAGTQAGSISQNGGTGVAYNTSSDHRLKENVTADWDATTRLKQLNPVRFNFIADADTTVDGFLAHEVQSVVPEAISGTHNEVKVWREHEELPDGVSVGDNKLDEDGNTIPVYQGIDQSKLVPLLVKTIQELEARITTLENA
jgi:hypothetical protein